MSGIGGCREMLRRRKQKTVLHELTFEGDAGSTTRPHANDKK
jgi:hypothetical protein